MPKRLRHHVNPLKSDFATTRAGPVALPEQGEVEVELGCADAQFLFGRAAQDPRLTCIGIEIRRELVEEVNRKAAARGLHNLRAVFANINVDLARLFPPSSLDRVFLHFPDPWFKRRHHKRRVLTPEVAATIARQLVPGGVLFFQSDVFDLALDAMDVLEREPGLRNHLGAWSFAPENIWKIKTLREERHEERGKRIWRLDFRRPRD